VEIVSFGPITIEFDDTVLRPRDWIIAQSEWAAELSSLVPDGPILELASGAGHIGLAAAVLCGRPLVQVDLSEDACRWGARNAERAGVADRVEVRCGSFTDALDGAERFPLVIADPPYVPTADTARFPEDPLRAIDGGADGLALVAECLRVAAAHLQPAGAVVLQVWGQAQVEALGDLCPALEVVEVRTFGPDRALVQLRLP
jgi:methylase of polypeptide subunit release factors